LSTEIVVLGVAYLQDDFDSFVGWAGQPVPRMFGRAVRPTPQASSLHSAMLVLAEFW